MVEKSHTSGFWPSVADPLRQPNTRVGDWIAPAAEAAVKGDAYAIAVELPGVAEEDIDLSLHDGVLALKGEKRTSREEKGETWFFSERQYGAFSRSFKLPPDADPGRVQADLKDGVLTISVGKKSPQAPPQAKIAIRKG